MSYQTQKIITMKKNNKELPKWYDGANYTEGDTVTNPFSGESYELNANELTSVCFNLSLLDSFLTY